MHEGGDEPGLQGAAGCLVAHTHTVGTLRKRQVTQRNGEPAAPRGGVWFNSLKRPSSDKGSLFCKELPGDFWWLEGEGTGGRHACQCASVNAKEQHAFGTLECPSDRWI